ncbi:MAG: hypothetical protein V4616_13345 [Bacteroidota bacterium]
MKTKFAPLSLFLFLGIAFISTQAKAVGPQPDQGENTRSDFGAANLTLFKLFTVQPEKKTPSKGQVRQKTVQKSDADKKEQLLFPAPVIDRIRK